MVHIFISYAKKDTRNLALKIHESLNTLSGVTAWMDQSLEVGESFALKIQEEIDRCDCMVVLLSPDVHRSETDDQHKSFVQNEIDYARDAHKRFIPLMAQHTTVPVQLAGIQYIDFTQSTEVGLQKLWAAVARLMDQHLPLLSADPKTLQRGTSRTAKEGSLSSKEQRDRSKVLEQVRQDWVEGWLKTMLRGMPPIELTKVDRSDLVNPHMPPEFKERYVTLPPEVTITHFFETRGQSILITGEPGSGKTIALLELTRDMLRRAEKDPSQPIPIPFILSSWGEEQSLRDWLIEELCRGYPIQPPTATEWLDTEKIMLLLDGLDEFGPDEPGKMSACIRAINEFNRERGLSVQIAVACRLQNLEASDEQLSLRSAVYLRQLSEKQIDDFLKTLGAGFDGLRQALQSDLNLQKLIDSPLMLYVITEAYQGISVNDLMALDTAEARQRKLFDTYISTMFSHRGHLKITSGSPMKSGNWTLGVKPHLSAAHQWKRPNFQIASRKTEGTYSNEQTIHWLSWLAFQMGKHHSPSAFLIEDMQPDWLMSDQQFRFYRLGIAAPFALAAGVGWTIPLVLALGLVLGATNGLYAAVFIGVFVALYWLIRIYTDERRWLAEGRKTIKPVDSVAWSWNKLKSVIVLGVGVSSGIVASVYINPVKGLLAGVAAGIAIGVSIGQSGKTNEKEETTDVNQGMWHSCRNYLIGSVIQCVAFGLVGVLVFGAPGLLFCPVGALAFAMGGGGGLPLLQHFVLRSILYEGGFTPLNYQQFLDYASEIVLMKKIGGGYLFWHMFLREHFAQIWMHKQKVRPDV